MSEVRASGDLTNRLKQSVIDGCESVCGHLQRAQVLWMVATLDQPISVENPRVAGIAVRSRLA